MQYEVTKKKKDEQKQRMELYQKKMQRLSERKEKK